MLFREWVRIKGKIESTDINQLAAGTHSQSACRRAGHRLAGRLTFPCTPDRIRSGGAGLPQQSPYYQDRLYVNNGKGVFTFAAEALPDTRASGSLVTAADYDRDGDLDLFVGGRVDLEYPIPERSLLLRNDCDASGIRFRDVTRLVVSISVERAGLVGAALWTDFDQDGWTDLVLAGEWMPIKFYKNEKGKFIDVTSSFGMNQNAYAEELAEN